MLHLYPYQQKLIARIRAEMAAGRRRILVQAPTGAGKTVLFTFIVAEMLKRGKRGLIVTDRIELLTETGGTLQKFGIVAEEVLAGQKTPPAGPIVIAMSQTLKRRLLKWEDWIDSFDVLIFDEAHKAEFDAYFRRKHPGIVLGFTATPIRSGKQLELGKCYDVLIQGPQVPELVRDGYLVRDRYYGIGGVDMAGVEVTNLGDYHEGQMFERYDRPKLYAGAVENWQQHAAGRITLGFCVNIIHTVRTCAAFNAAGIAAKFITSEPEKRTEEYLQGFAKWSGKRDEVLAEWKRGEFPVLLNAGILTTGFNHPPIEAILVNRATASLPLWLQIMGRGSRTAPGKDSFIVLDLGDNGARHGYYNQQRDWSLWHKAGKGGGAAPVKLCPKCEAMIYAVQMVCPFCDYAYPEEVRLDAQLAEVDYTATRPAVDPEVLEYISLERFAESRGYKAGWVVHQVVAKQGLGGLRLYAKFKGYNIAWVWRMEKQMRSRKGGR